MWLKNITNSPAYILFVVLIIQPMNGFIIARGDVLLGIVLIALQAIWIIGDILPRLENPAN